MSMAELALILGLAASVVALAGFTWRIVRGGHRRIRTFPGRFVAKHVAPVAAEAAAVAATAHLEKMVTDKLQPVIAQLSPNSGSSAFDKLTRLDQWRADFTRAVADDFADVKQHLTEQDRAMVQHLRDHARH
jgi:hypothetical protein